MKKKCVIVGYGGMGAYHAETIAALDYLEVAGVYDIAPEARARAQERGLTAFSSEEEAGEAEADFALLAVPNQLHRY